jgi:rhodanese-related sulfurtransferase
MDNNIPRITCEELKTEIEKGEKVIIVDTRAAAYYKADHIKSAINIFYNPSGDPFERQMTFMSLPADKPLVIYCECSDESDSSLMANEIKNQRYEIENIRVLLQGINRWKELGYPTEKSEF